MLSPPRHHQNPSFRHCEICWKKIVAISSISTHTLFFCILAIQTVRMSFSVIDRHAERMFAFTTPNINPTCIKYFIIVFLR